MSAGGGAVSEGSRGPFVTPEVHQQSAGGPLAHFASTANHQHATTAKEDPATVQDANFAAFFAHFLRVYKGPGTTEEDPEPEGIEGFPTEITEFYYLRRIAAVLQRQRRVCSLFVSLKDLEGWVPSGAPVEDAGLKLAHHIRKNYIRIQPLLQERLQQLANEVAQRISCIASPVYLQLHDIPRYIHSISSVRCTDPVKCSTPDCHNTRNWKLIPELSEFSDWQKLRLQEPTGEMQASGLPRSIDVIVRHSLVDKVYAGDVVLVTGALIAVPDVPALLKPGENPRVCLLAVQIESISSNQHEIILDDSREVWGHEDVKKGLLLTITGGVTKETGSSRLRQGDPDQGDYVLEAGALMYADQGICCIDEFDKMDDKDRVAIHEAMEQQTISIAKAGIQATLNARASVLAACNPRFGRYDRSKSFAANVQIPPPLLSRFDLLFTLIDEIDEERDKAIFEHLASYHLSPEDAAATATAAIAADCLTQDELRLYVECAQKLTPIITDEAKQRLIEAYVALRLLDCQPGAQHNMRITVRQLESLIRLSEAVARLHFSDFVLEEHAQEAVEIFRSSLHRILHTEDIDLSAAVAAAAGEKENAAGVVEGGDTGGGEEEDGAAGGAAAAAAAATQEIRIRHADYRRISCQLIDYIKQKETEKEQQEDNPSPFQGVSSTSVIEW
ncbi:DNA replication licensing factor, putative [Eimeria maxima]|uniref:DNA helicase n=1 Tax=Eimeria maxima TaxID=5804 RepID=U6LZE7_EIMMA|nr:DNA replication licensing factor, putative [Eimeria maxima]CDJ57347.1 DNA replication licensing factor, putative [Eimeria maxima]